MTTNSPSLFIFPITPQTIPVTLSLTSSGVKTSLILPYSSSKMTKSSSPKKLVLNSCVETLTYGK